MFYSYSFKKNVLFLEREKENGMIPIPSKRSALFLERKKENGMDTDIMVIIVSEHSTLLCQRYCAPLVSCY